MTESGTTRARKLATTVSTTDGMPAAELSAFEPGAR
jgi:hypothetical protein